MLKSRGVEKDTYGELLTGVRTKYSSFKATNVWLWNVSPNEINLRLLARVLMFVDLCEFACVYMQIKHLLSYSYIALE